MKVKSLDKQKVEKTFILIWAPSESQNIARVQRKKQRDCVGVFYLGSISYPTKAQLDALLIYS